MMHGQPNIKISHFPFTYKNISAFGVEMSPYFLIYVLKSQIFFPALFLRITLRADIVVWYANR